MSSPFTIAHLSDLHLTSNDSRSRSEPKLYGKLRGMNAAFRHIAGSDPVQRSDLLLITGDVTDDGTKAAWEGFWKTIRQNGLQERCLVIPGNHDVCCLGSRILTGEKSRFVADLEKMRAGLALGGNAAPTRFPHTTLYGGVNGRGHDIAIIALDSCNKGNSTAVTNAIGMLGRRQLEGLARVLKKYRDVPVKIVAMHHSPNIPGKVTALRRGLENMGDLERWGMEVPEDDRRALRWICLAGSVRLIVHGHVHRQEDRPVNGVRMVGAPATTEPVSRSGTKTYFFWRYTVSTNRKIVKREIVSV